MKGLFRPESFKGAAYLASANFLARGLILFDHFLKSLFTYEMILLYGAHLDSHILLFFQAVFMIPVFLLGLLLFFGIEKESFNLVLYPSLLVLFLILLRYGAEFALLLIHWEAHKTNQAPGLIFYLIVDLFSIAILLFYVYFSLTATPIPSTPFGYPLRDLQDLEVIAESNFKPEGANKVLNPPKGVNGDLNGANKELKKKKKKLPAPPPEGILGSEVEGSLPPPRPPQSPKFNYNLRRNVAQLPQGSPERAMLDELDKQKQRNSQILVQEDEKEEESKLKIRGKTQSLKVYDSEPKRRSLLCIETDLDAEEVNKGPSPDVPTEAEIEANKEEEKALKVEAEIEANKEEAKALEVESKTEEEEDDDEGEWEYEYEEEEEEELPLPPPSPGPSNSPGSPQQGPSESYKTTAV